MSNEYFHLNNSIPNGRKNIFVFEKFKKSV